MDNRDAGENNPYVKVSNENCIAIARGYNNGLEMAWMASHAGIHITTAHKCKKRGDALLSNLSEGERGD